MKILITGANGFIGSYFMEYMKDDFEVVGLVRSNKDIKREYKYIISDLSEGVSLSEHIDVIIHCAAELDRQHKSMESYIKGNVIATQNLLDFARKNGVYKIINLNGVRCFGNVQERIISELTPIVDPGNYGITKAIAEKLLIDSDIPTVSLILPGIVGKNGHTPWLMRVSRDLLNNRSVDCYDPDAPFNNILHVNTLAKIVKQLLEFTVHKNERVLLGSRNYISKYEVLCFLKNGLGSDSIIEIVDSRDISFYLNIEKARKMGIYLPNVKDELGKLIGDLK